MLRQFSCRRSIYTHVVTLNVDFTLDSEPVERLTDNEKRNIKYISL